jgi:ribosomal protein S18 acetylase RimI-like enzyme
MSAGGGVMVPSASAAGEICLRDECSEDAEFLYSLYAAARAEEMALTPWNDVQKESFLRMQFQLQSEHYHRYYPDAQFQIILSGGRAVGRLYVHRGSEEIRVIDISVSPEHRGRGIGSTLMRELLAEAAGAGKPVTLHVERNNRALELYERLGFELREDKGIYLFLGWQPGSVNGDVAPAGA